MIEWLLKDEKNKIGRPKLANEELIKRSKILIACSLLVSLILLSGFICTIKNITPVELLYKITNNKLNGVIDNKNGFTYKDYYDANKDLVIKINIPSKIRNLSGNYKYTTYYLKNNDWIEYETKEIENNKSSFDIKLKSIKNQNRTWKVKFWIINSSGIKESYAPYSWKFNLSQKAGESYAYKIFTVKGYYSPVPLKEINEAKKEKEKVYINTKKANPRSLILNVPLYKYKVNVSYVDPSGKKTTVSKKDDLNGVTIYDIPSTNYSLKVTIKVWIDNANSDELNKLKLSSWKLVEDKKNGDYIMTTYVIKPESAY